MKLIKLSFCVFFWGFFFQNGFTQTKADTSFTQLKISTLAFGSCNDQNEPQPLWKDIHKNKPQVWLWLGDNIYADTEDMQLMKKMYQQQSQNTDYQKLIKNILVFGIWDDHDYGKNDAGNDYVKRAESQQLLLDFLNVGANSLRRKRTGAYSSQVLGKIGEQVKIILLDERYFRDSIQKVNDAYIANSSGTFLGEEQWQWFESQLADSQSTIHIIGGGIQFISDKHRFEKWANFPHERQRFLDLIQKYKPKNLILLSGDRHIGEFAKINLPHYPHPIFELTSSGLSHYSKEYSGELNDYRVGKAFNQLNFGLIKIDWQKKQLFLQLRGEKNQILQEQFIPLK